MDAERQHLLTPDRVGAIQDLKPENSGTIVLGPETRVLCINRGREPYHDTFDSRHYTIAPGFFTTQYDAAQHFRARAVVPGSRNPETHFQASFIAIIGVVNPETSGLRVLKPIDPVDAWDPFTDDECREYGHAVEALDRANMIDPIEPDITLVQTPGTGGPAGKPSRVKSGPAGKPSRGSTRIEGSGTKALQPGKTGSNVAESLNEGDV